MEQISTLAMRECQIWDLLEDPTLPPLDRQTLNEEIDEIHNQVMELERRLLGFTVMYYEEDESCESESIGPDEYDREGLIIYGGFDLADEI
jgi:hypothetical protein